jgi:hypothetical protein
MRGACVSICTALQTCGTTNNSVVAQLGLRSLGVEGVEWGWAYFTWHRRSRVILEVLKGLAPPCLRPSDP